MYVCFLRTIYQNMDASLQKQAFNGTSFFIHEIALVYYEYLADGNIDLGICGHYHGGQFRFPVVGGLYHGSLPFPCRTAQHTAQTPKWDFGFY